VGYGKKGLLRGGEKDEKLISNKKTSMSNSPKFEGGEARDPVLMNRGRERKKRNKGMRRTNRKPRHLTINHMILDSRNSGKGGVRNCGTGLIKPVFREVREKGGRCNALPK